MLICLVPRISRILIGTLLILTGVTATAQAQFEEPIGRFVIDARGSFVPFGKNAELAVARNLVPADTPSIGLGFDIGAHYYFFRWRVITFGIGANIHKSFSDQSPSESDSKLSAPTLRKTFSAVSPQISFNFGNRNGWSYISGGMGTSKLALFPLNEDAPSQRATSTINYGGGVRWFLNEHVAFSLDLRFYAGSPLTATSTEPASPRVTTTIASAGVSFK
tara:strand:- start:387 stop:1046 length:660 start_codon:yes stop_codon:yes gene_type:complete